MGFWESTQTREISEEKEEAKYTGLSFIAHVIWVRRAWMECFTEWDDAPPDPTVLKLLWRLPFLEKVEVWVD